MTSTDVEYRQMKEPSKSSSAQHSGSSITFWLVISISHALLGVFLLGYNIALFNVPGNTIRHHAAKQPIDDFPWEIVNAMFPIGGLIGASFSGKMADRVGRKRMIIFNAIINIIASVLTGTSSYYVQLLCGRFLTGIGSGSGTVVSSAYLNEISSDELRGAIGTLLQLFITIAIVTAELLGKIYETDPFWRYGCFLCGVLCVVQLLLSGTILESPQWLLKQDRTAEAITVLKKLRGSKYLSDSLSIQIKKSITVNIDEENLDENTNSPSIEHVTEQLLHSDNTNKQKQYQQTSLWSAVIKHNAFRKILFISMLLHMLQQLSGINVVFYYSDDILKAAGFNNSWLGSVLLSTANFLAVVMVTPFVDRWGRKPLLLLSSVGMAISSATITVTFIGLNKYDGTNEETSWGIGMVICMIFFVMFFEFGLGPIPWLYVTEITPIEYRATMVSIAQVVNYFCNTIIALTSTTLLEALDVYGFIPFGIITIVGFMIIFLFVPETKQKTTEQIIKELDPKYNRF